MSAPWNKYQCPNFRNENLRKIDQFVQYYTSVKTKSRFLSKYTATSRPVFLKPNAMDSHQYYWRIGLQAPQNHMTVCCFCTKHHTSMDSPYGIR